MNDRCNCDCHHNHSSGEGKALAGLLLGGIIGAGIAVYLQTDQGKEKLKELKKHAMKYKGELEDKMDEVKAEKIDPLLEEAKSEFQNTVKRWKTEVGGTKTKKA
jgi:gas vesicle protein